MGSGIAEVCARAGCDVVVREVSEEALDSGRRRIETSLARAVKCGRITEAESDEAFGRIRFTTHLGDLADRRMVIEAVVEAESAKVDIFRLLDGVVVDRNAVLASNTSSIPIM